ncbi:retrovirus-related pol polyprotein from transposon TNT 1-94, partial [Tanacetum coccineum]
MTGDRSRLMNFVKKFIGTVRFGNDHFGAIMGYGDYVIGDSVISRVYYVEGLGHNLFSVGQFCDSDLEVAFRKHSCYVRDTDGVELLKGSRGSNLYTISVEDMMKSSPICLLSKASKNKSWLWHRRLNHLNFGTINDLARKDLVRGLPRLKFEKDHLCSACQLGKSKKHTHKPKTENTNLEVLNTLHMDLCGPMRVQTINGKKYILVIVDDYSRFTWVKFLRSKDETSAVVIKFLTQIQVGLNKTVRFIRTDNGTEFVNKTLYDHYDKVGIFHQKTVPRTPQQNGVVERRNRTLVEAARTMLIFSKAPMFLWAEAVATACYTQNRSLIHTRHDKTPYELVHNKKPDLTFFRVFGALCYPTNDSENLGKLQPTADIGIFVGYAPNRKGYRIYNKRTRQIMETIHVTFDELTEQMAPVQFSSGPAPSVDVDLSFRVYPNREAVTVSSTSGKSTIPAPTNTSTHEHVWKWTDSHSMINTLGTLTTVSSRKSLLRMLLWCFYNSVLTKVRTKKLINLQLLKDLQGLSQQDAKSMTLIDWTYGNYTQDIHCNAARKNMTVSQMDGENAFLNGGLKEEVYVHQLKDPQYGSLVSEKTPPRALTAYARRRSCRCQDTRRSTLSVPQFLGDKLVSGHQRNKPAVHSSTKAEIHRDVAMLCPNPMDASQKTQRSPIFKIAVDILKQTNFFRAFTASSTIPAIYIQQFWDTIRFDRKAGSFKCQLDEQWFNLNQDTLRDALQITPVDNNRAFSSPPTPDTLVEFVNELGYPKEVVHLSTVTTNDMFQPWRALATIINLCLTGKTSGFERPRAPVLQILWGKKKATLILIPSIRFTKLIIFHLQRLHNFHPRPNSPLHLPTEEPVLGHLKFSAKGSKREIFGMTIPNELINHVIREADYYDAYLEKVSKHQRYIAGEELSDPESPAPKPAKPTKQAKPKATEQPTVSKTKAKKSKPAPAGKVTKKRNVKGLKQLVDEFVDERVPAAKPSLEDTEEAILQNQTNLLRFSLFLSRCVLADLRFLKKKSSAEQYILQSRSQLPTVTASHEESSSLYAELGLSGSDTESDEGMPSVGRSGTQDEGQAGSDPGTPDEGQAGSDPGTRDKGQAGPNLEHSNVAITDPSSQPHPEHMDEGFTAT